MSSKNDEPVITEYDEETGEWEIAEMDQTDDEFDAVSDRMFSQWAKADVSTETSPAAASRSLLAANRKLIEADE